MTNGRWWLVVAVGVGAGCGVEPPEGQLASALDTAPRALATLMTRTGGALRPPGGGKPKGNGIYYHGGPVMVPTKSAYLIWWGQWGGDTAQTILPTFLGDLSGSPWFGINATYYDGNNQAVGNSVAVIAEYKDTSLANNATITDGDVAAEVASVLGGGHLPADPNGVYFVLTPADVADASGFCSSWCGWHTWQSISGKVIKYAYIPNDARCPSACSAAPQGAATPNGNLGADAMASVLAHELSEMATDPELDAWYDHRGEENADKCAWTFGNTYTTANGATANLSLSGRSYLVQRNWVNAGGGYCSMTAP
jgi:Phosphate-induced protein 1 conserved region